VKKTSLLFGQFQIPNLNPDDFAKGLQTVMPDWIRHPECMKMTGFLPDSIRDLPK
jgi:hypothetical protein